MLLADFVTLTNLEFEFSHCQARLQESHSSSPYPYQILPHPSILGLGAYTFKPQLIWLMQGETEGLKLCTTISAEL
jgi:hypothetical protein